MMEIDTTGSWVNVIFQDGEITENTDGTMFADFVKPEFTYEYAKTTIQHGAEAANEIVTIVFDVTDRYFKETDLATDSSGSLITVKVDNDAATDTSITKTLTKVEDLYYPDNTGDKVGERYRLVITGLDEEDAYKYSGYMTLTFAAGIVIDTSGNANNATTITISRDSESELPNTDTTSPYLPDGYKKVPGTNLSNGLVIEDGDGNQFVWVEVPRTATVYPTAGLGIDKFTDTDYENIENDLQTYTTVYRNGTAYKDEYYSDATTGLTETEYNTQKKKMLKSIYINGGFYVGRYETGIADSYRTAAGATTQTPVIQQNAYPYNYVTTSQAQELSESFATTGYTSSLMFGMQWDLVLKYFETKGATQNELNLNSTNWGNYQNTLWNVTNTSAKYSTDTGATYTSAPYNKTETSGVLLTTGADSTFSKMGISDLAGNVYEWTLEKSSDSSYPCTLRGGGYGSYGINVPASGRSNVNTTNANSYFGFRTALYKDEGTGSDENIVVDVTDPMWEIENVNIDNTNRKVTADLIAEDKYFKQSTLTTDKIKIYIDGVALTTAQTDINVKKALTTPIYVKKDASGNYVDAESVDEAIGVKYTLTLSDWEENTKQSGKDYFEWSGTTKIEIAAETIEDRYTNKSNVQEFTLGHVDFIKPKIENFASAKDPSTKTETITFTVTDKYLDITDLLTEADIKVFIDGEPADTNADTTKNITENLSYVPITETRGATTVTVGHTYTLVLSDFEKARSSTGNTNYEDWSGTVSIEIPANSVKDQVITSANGQTSGGNVNDVATFTGDFVDFIKPDIQYLHQTSDINYIDKEYIMTFSITDKYYDTGLANNILTSADVTSGVLEILLTDRLGNQYNLKDEDVNITLTSEPVVVASMNKTTNVTNKTVGTATNVTIGHTYQLKISNLENVLIESGDLTANHSGVITVTIDANEIKDAQTSGVDDALGNNAKTLTSGITYSADVNSGIEVPVDVVDPLINMVSTSANAINQEAYVTFKATDTYYSETKLSASTMSQYIKVFVNGSETSIVPTIEETTPLTTDVVNGGTTTTVQYGIQYKLKISGFDQDVNQVKIQIQENMILDDTGTGTKNGNKVTEIIVYNSLRLTTTETGFASAFLGIPIQRKDVQKVEFLSSTAGAGATTYDVSAQQDNSIKAWYTTNASGAHTVYIASDSEMFANQNSTNLFQYIASGNVCTETQAVTNLNILNTNSVTNMNNMFAFFGFKAMTSLDLGNFDTTNVTTMREMFNSCGYTAMSTLKLGNNFKTNNVTDMSWMFTNTGYTAMTSMNLGANFNTSAVTDMSYMFMATGYTAMTNIYFGTETGTAGVITLADSFNTSSVTDMEYMFKMFGYTAMTQLNLGNSFNTGNVLTMRSMFEETGYTAMTTLDIGDNFNTSSVTDMNKMFRYCGYTAMTGLDLSSGTASTNTTQFNTISVTDMGSMFEYCGRTAMITLNLGNNFDTRNVTDMNYMFAYTGAVSMTSLNLGGKFDTSKVTNMSGMFSLTGYYEMTSLNLGNYFNTSAVTDMSQMFLSCGFTKLTSLDLGDLFYTTNVTNMNQMFEQCGSTLMTSLDLGPAFTKIASTKTNFVNETGKSGECIIYAPESIYKNKNAFKLNSTDTTETPTDLQYTRGTINPIYKPEWTITSALDTTNKELEITIKGTAIESQTIDSNVKINYSSNVTGALEIGHIQAFIDGNDVTSHLIDASKKPDGTLTAPGTLTGADVTYTLTLSDFEELVRQAGKNFLEWSGNVLIKIAGRGEATSTYTANILKDIYGNQSMMATDETGTWIDIEFKDGEIVANQSGKLYADYIKPEFTYEYSNTTIEHGAAAVNEVVTVVFDVTDKYFKETDLATDTNAELITVKFDDDDALNNDENVSKTLTKTAIFVMNTDTEVVTSKAVDYTLQAGERKVGERYQLVVTGLDREDGFTYSGYMTLAFDSGLVRDNSGNGNNAKTITIGKNEPGGSDSDKVIVDVVDPLWVLGDISLTDGTIDLHITDKYLDSIESVFALDPEDITVYVNGTLDGDTNGNGVLDGSEASTIQKTITGPIQITANKEYKYVLQLSNITPEGGNYVEFTPLESIIGGNAEFKDENGGSIAITIAANTITDEHGNTSNLTPFTIGVLDETKPEIYEVSETADATADTETIIFNVTDKNYCEKDGSGNDIIGDDQQITKDEITVLVDGVAVDRLIQDAATTLSGVKIRTILNGVETTVGYQYTLVIADLAETARQLGKDYLEYSGTVEIRIDEDAVKDVKGNTLDVETTTIKDFVDYIRPEIRYVHQNSDVNYVDEAKSYSMTFEITDKYYNSTDANNKLSVDDLTILMQNGQVDSNGDLKIYDLKTEDVTIALNSAPIRASMNKTTDVVNETYVAVTNEIIGYRYTLTISDLEKMFIESGNTTADYSGVITVAIAENSVYDEGPATDGGGNTVDTALGNSAKTLTSGITFKDGEESGSQMPIDVVDPLVTKVSTSANAIDPANTTSSIAYVTFNVTDTYFAESKLTSANIADHIKVVVNGSVTSIVPTIEEATELKEDRLVNGVETEVQYGIQYKLKITGFAQNANQVRIRVLEDMVLDKDPGTTVQNGNKETDIIVYNVLELTSNEGQTDGFLDGNGTNATGIARQDIHKVIFTTSLDGATAAGVQKVWDVSAQNDGSIKAWTSQTSAPYTVYIGSDDEIFANQNSTKLFGYIGYAESSTAEDTIENLNLLNTNSVTNMTRMFQYCGHDAMTSLNLGVFDTKNVTTMEYMFDSCGYDVMTSLNLGTAFDTSNVVNMHGMFANCGYTKMQTLSLGSLFDTSSVTTMKLMFGNCGYTEMTSLNLGSKFDTSNVENMQRMFQNCGYVKMTTLSLGSLFDTRKVEDMSYMFLNCGYKKLGSLDLSSGTATSNTTQFNTSAVTNMQGMFFYLGYESMTSLNLGNNFDTTNVTNMRYMFNSCGYGKMTSLDLKDKFNTAKVTDMYGMFTECGYTEMTYLRLGNKFYTTSVTDMYKMFNGCGKTKMTILDLGPAFTRIPGQAIPETNEVTYNANGTETINVIPAHNSTDYFITDCGTISLVIYAPESIYSDRTHIKLDRNSTTTIEVTAGTVNPVYRPEWEKVASTTAIDTTNKTLTVTIKGTANKTFTNGRYSETYTSAVQSYLPVGTTLTAEQAKLINVWIDKELDGDINGNGILDEGETPKLTRKVEEVSITANEVQYKITLSNFEEAIRQIGKNFKEWSGNITIQPVNQTLIDKYGSYLKDDTDGEGNPIKVPEIAVFTDASGNKIGNANMQEIDLTAGTWSRIEISDTAINANTAGTMFADYIKPEFTYKYSVGDINYGDKTLTVVFDVTDKYFDTATIDEDDITVAMMDETTTVNTDITKTLTIKTLATDVTEGNIIYKRDGSIYYDFADGSNRRIGTRYELVIENLQQNPSDGYTYSGPISLTFASGLASDKSGNENNAKTISIGRDETGNSTSENYNSTNPYLPDGYKFVDGTSISTGLVIEDSLGNQFVWVEVPKTTTVYPTAGLNIKSFTNEEFDKIEDDLHAYTSTYGDATSSVDEYFSDEMTGLTNTEYTMLKQNMLRSIYKNGGFYVGRYETGIDYNEGDRTSSGDTTQTPVIKQNAYPYNYLTTSQAQELSESFATDGYTSSLMYNVQWRLILKYLESKGVAQEQLKTNSTTWGNYKNSNYNITNTNAKYNVYNEGALVGWTYAPYEKNTSDSFAILTTGADDIFSKQNIYDLAGNIAEYTLGCYSGENAGNVVQGGMFNTDGDTYVVQSRMNIGMNNTGGNIGFRTALFKNEEVTVDVVDPIWTGPVDVNQIKRNRDNAANTNTVEITILGSDKYFEESTLTTGNIEVYVDNVENTTITKDLTEITNATTLQTLATGAGLDGAAVGYTLTLGNFGENNGVVKIEIAEGTLHDTSGNINEETTINVGNIEWEEANEPLESSDPDYPRYTAFRNHIVDFIKPEITYQYSTVVGSENPDIDYEAKTVTVKFDVTDKYLLESTIINADGTLNTDAVRILIHDDTTGMTDRTDLLTTSITSETITNGYRYTLVVSNIQQPNADPGVNTDPSTDIGDGFNFSGPMQLVFAEGKIDDTSGNKNDTKTITLDTEIGPDVVDVVDPIIFYNTNSYSSIDRVNDGITVSLRAEDKYLSSQTLTTIANQIVVRVEKPNGEVVESTGTSATITKVDGTTINSDTIIERTITNPYFGDQYATFRVILSNFGLHEGVTSLIIPADVIKDTSDNGNVETEIFVGNPNHTTAFKDSIVDFTDPVWTYEVSSIDRQWDANGVRIENGTVTLEIKGTDIYFENSTLTESNIKVYKNNGATEVELTDVTKTLVKEADGVTIAKEAVSETDANRDIQIGEKYTLILGNFGTNEADEISIKIDGNTVVDTSTNGNQETEIFVGNSTWVETDEALEETDPNYPRYTAFRNNIVDFIKPTVTLDGATIDRTVNDQKVVITFTAKDTNGLADGINIGLEDLKIFVDDDHEMQVYGTGTTAANTLLEVDLDEAGLPSGVTGVGKQYTLTLSSFELADLLGEEEFLRHSGRIKIVVAADQVEDTSGNKNIETTLIVNEFEESDGSTIEVADFVKPIIYLNPDNNRYINYSDRYAEIYIKATDRFYDTTTEITPEDITVYEQNRLGQYIQINNFDGKIDVEKVAITDDYGNTLGYDYTIRLNEFQEEYKVKVTIPANIIGDTSGNFNEAVETELQLALDNMKPRWEYVSTDTSAFESAGNVTFNVKGVDKFLDIDDSGLTVADLKVLKDGQVFIDGATTEGASKLTLIEGTTNQEEASIAYQINITGLTEMGTYSLVFAEKTLIDEFGNESAAKTITFSNSALATNTDNYVMVTYHVSPDNEMIHNSYVHELMDVNESGTNFESTTYHPSSLGELYNNGENPLFAEPAGYSFVGWAEADEKGNVKYYTNSTYTTISEEETAYTRVYDLYNEIFYRKDSDLNEVEDPEDDGIDKSYGVHLRAIWQEATVIYVSKNGSNSNNGTSTTTPVKDLQTAYSKLNPSGKDTNNIIVIMDEVEFNSIETLNGNATITSLYAGVDYRKLGAELKISSNMTVNGDVTFDNIELYANSTTVSNGSDYLANGTYSNMLISNYSGDIILGRGITTPTDKYTFGAIIGGNYKNETSTGNLGEHELRVEAGKYNNIIAGSTLTSPTDTPKLFEQYAVIGNIRDTAVSRNDKLTVTGYFAMGENENQVHPVGLEGPSTPYSRTYVYSGTFTGINKFDKSSEDTVMYLRSINGQTDGGDAWLDMYGGLINGNIYGGSIVDFTGGSDDSNRNKMNFYGGNVIGNIFGKGENTIFAGYSSIELSGNFNITGNIYGGSNLTTEVSEYTVIGTGNSYIEISSSSATVNGNIYGGSKAATETTGYIQGDSIVTIRSGTVNNIYGGGYNSDISGTATITIANGVVNQNIYGGGYQGQVRTSSEITVTGGTIQGNIFGGSQNTTETQLTNDTITQDVYITICGSEFIPEPMLNGSLYTTTTKPTINGNIYGGGPYDKVGISNIYLEECENIISVYGGATTNSNVTEANIYLQGMTVNSIYGGGNTAGTVETANIYLKSGTATDVYGGGYKANVGTANIYLGVTETIDDEEVITGTANITSIYGGPNQSGTVTTSNVILKSGNLTNVFGGGNSASVGTANVTLDGITIDTIHGGSKDAGVTTTTNVTLNSGSVETVFGGGLDVGVGTSNVTNNGVTVTNIYGGNNSGTGSGGDTGTTNVNIINSTVENVYGGNYLKGTTKDANITILGTSTITGKLYGGGQQSAIGKSDDPGSTTINIYGGTINKDINGGSEQSVVYGNTNINVGIDTIADYSLEFGDIEIKGNIYGSGDSTGDDYSYISVQGNTYITMDNGIDSPITFSGSIFGSGKGATYSTQGTDSDISTIHLKDFGSSTDAYELISIERTGKLNIGNSFIELSGRQDKYNASPRTSYTLNRITNGLTIYNNTTLYTQRGFNMVGGFGSYRTLGGTKQTVSFTGASGVTTNVDNRLYTFEGINLIFANKEEAELYTNPVKEDWGDVNGMAFFGMYALNRSTNEKVFDIYAPNYTSGAVKGFFSNGTFVEAKHKSSHNITVDGFYTNVADYSDLSNITVTPELISTTDYTAYYDWIIGAETVTYNVEHLIASTYQKDNMEEVILDHQYAQGATYTLTDVSLNALDTSVNLVNPLTIPLISANANNTFGLTIETDNTGWLDDGVTEIYTASGGSFSGDSTYKTDNTTTPGKIKFKLTNSINITEQKDLGNVNLVFTGKVPPAADGTGGRTFIVVIAVNIQTVVDELKESYEPKFTDSEATELSYTTDSRVDLTYLLYKDYETTPYESGDYRVISTTEQLPAGTTITMKDYGQGEGSNKVYYYHITGATSEYEVEGGRYIYKLADFRDIGSTNDYYSDIENNIPYYNSTDKYAFEKFDISIDFIDSGINTDKLAQETYLELRNSDKSVQYDNGDTTIKYNLYTNKNAVFTQTVTHAEPSPTYSVVETLDIPLTITNSVFEQAGVMDTKYHDQIAGMAIQIVGESGVRIKSPELQNFKLTNTVTGEVWEADSNGVIRIPIIEGFGTKTGDYKLSIAQANVTPGKYTAQVRFFTADDGKYYGVVPAVEHTFDITFVSRLLGLVGVEASDDSRIINKSTGLNLEDGSTVNKAIDMTVSIGSPTNETNIRVELYKRNSTYTAIDGTGTYTGTQYTLVDIGQYLQGTWQKPSIFGLTNANAYEYMISPKKTYATPVELETLEFERAIKEGISTGEYKLVFKAYSDDTLVQTIKKTFIVTP